MNFEPVSVETAKLREVSMRRVTVLLLALGLALGLAGCGKKGPLERPEPEKQEEGTSG